MKKNEKLEVQYWNNFYDQNVDKEVFLIPSQFCCLMATEIEQNIAVAEFGCGNGRDSFFLARHNFNVVAMDLSSKAIEINVKKSSLMNNIEFYCGDVTSDNDVNQVLTRTRKYSKSKNIVVYNRFFLHTLDDSQEKKFIKILSDQLISKDKLYFEFRTGADEKTEKVYNKHFRRFVCVDNFTDLLKECHFQIEYRYEGQGVAKFKSEDAIVARIIATKK